VQGAGRGGLASRRPHQTLAAAQRVIRMPRRGTPRGVPPLRRGARSVSPSRAGRARAPPAPPRRAVVVDMSLGRPIASFEVAGVIEQGVQHVAQLLTAVGCGLPARALRAELARPRRLHALHAPPLRDSTAPAWSVQPRPRPALPRMPSTDACAGCECADQRRCSRCSKAAGGPASSARTRRCSVRPCASWRRDAHVCVVSMESAQPHTYSSSTSRRLFRTTARGIGGGPLPGYVRTGPTLLVPAAQPPPTTAPG